MVKVKAYNNCYLRQKTCITVLSSVNAAGHAIPSLAWYLVVIGWMAKHSMNGLSTTFLNMLHLADLYCSYSMVTLHIITLNLLLVLFKKE